MFGEKMKGKPTSANVGERNRIGQKKNYLRMFLEFNPNEENSVDHFFEKFKNYGIIKKLHQMYLGNQDKYEKLVKSINELNSKLNYMYTYDTKSLQQCIKENDINCAKYLLENGNLCDVSGLCSKEMYQLIKNHRDKMHSNEELIYLEDVHFDFRPKFDLSKSEQFGREPILVDPRTGLSSIDEMLLSECTFNFEKCRWLFEKSIKEKDINSIQELFRVRFNISIDKIILNLFDMACGFEQIEELFLERITNQVIDKIFESMVCKNNIKNVSYIINNRSLKNKQKYPFLAVQKGSLEVFNIIYESNQFDCSKAFHYLLNRANLVKFKDKELLLKLMKIALEREPNQDIENGLKIYQNIIKGKPISDYQIPKNYLCLLLIYQLVAKYNLVDFVEKNQIPFFEGYHLIRDDLVKTQAGLNILEAMKNSRKPFIENKKKEINIYDVFRNSEMLSDYDRSLLNFNNDEYLVVENNGIGPLYDENMVFIGFKFGDPSYAEHFATIGSYDYCYDDSHYLDPTFINFLKRTNQNQLLEFFQQLEKFYQDNLSEVLKRADLGTPIFSFILGKSLSEENLIYLSENMPIEGKQNFLEYVVLNYDSEKLRKVISNFLIIKDNDNTDLYASIIEKCSNDKFLILLENGFSPTSAMKVALNSSMDYVRLVLNYSPDMNSIRPKHIKKFNDSIYYYLKHLYTNVDTKGLDAIFEKALDSYNLTLIKFIIRYFSYTPSRSFINQSLVGGNFIFQYFYEEGMLKQPNEKILDIALSFRNEAIVKALIKDGVTNCFKVPNNLDKMSLVDMFAKYDPNFDPCFLLSNFKDYKDVVQQIIKKYIDPNNPMRNGLNVLERVIDGQLSEKILMMIIDMARKEALIEDIILKAVSKKYSLTVIERLFTLGAKIGTKDADENTELHLAMKKDYGDVVKYLIQKGCDVNAENKYKELPISIAICKELSDIVEILLDNGSKIVNINENYPVGIASQNGDSKTLAALISHGAAIPMSNINVLCTLAKHPDTIKYCGMVFGMGVTLPISSYEKLIPALLINPTPESTMRVEREIIPKLLSLDKNKVEAMLKCWLLMENTIPALQLMYRIGIRLSSDHLIEVNDPDVAGIIEEFGARPCGNRVDIMKTFYRDWTHFSILTDSRSYSPIFTIKEHYRFRRLTPAERIYYGSRFDSGIILI